jgi:hypothetical protein
MPDKKEIIAATLKGAAAGVPFVGGVLAELGDLFLNPIQKRRENWHTEVKSALNEIKNKYGLLPHEIEADDKFVSALLSATPIAIKTHQQEKIKALKNALINVSNPDDEDFDMSQQFIRYIDELGVIHLKVLAGLNKYSDQISKLEKMERVYSELTKKIGLKIERLPFRTIVQDLHSRFLIQIGDIEEYPEFATKTENFVAENSGINPLTVTELGRNFLEFIGEFDP